LKFCYFPVQIFVFRIRYGDHFFHGTKVLMF
jgi:hypothetical protein